MRRDHCIPNKNVVQRYFKMSVQESLTSCECVQDELSYTMTFHGIPLPVRSTFLHHEKKKKKSKTALFSALPSIQVLLGNYLNQNIGKCTVKRDLQKKTFCDCNAPFNSNENNVQHDYTPTSRLLHKQNEMKSSLNLKLHAKLTLKARPKTCLWQSESKYFITEFFPVHINNLCNPLAAASAYGPLGVQTCPVSCLLTVKVPSYANVLISFHRFQQWNAASIYAPYRSAALLTTLRWQSLHPIHWPIPMGVL